MGDIDVMALYNSLIEAEAQSELTGINPLYDYDGNDSEDFMTSNEIVKKKQVIEERFGVKPAGYVEFEEEVHFKSYRNKHQHKYTESEMESIRQSCMRTIVHDYGPNDIYHQSDEERARNDMLAEISLKLGGLKRTYHQVDQYVEAMRVVMEAWEILEKNCNFIHTRDEFYTMVGEGKIASNRITMPKLKKMDRYNLDTIIKYISNPELDASELKPKVDEKEDDFYNDEYDDFYQEFIDKHEEDDEYDDNSLQLHHDADKYAKSKVEEARFVRVMSPDDADYIAEHTDNPESITIKRIPRKYIKGYDRRTFGRKKKKGSKTDRLITADVQDLLNKIQSNPANMDDSSDYTHSYMLTHSMFNVEKAPKDFWDELYFDGSWDSKEDVFVYDLAVREELMKQHPPREHYLTYGDKEVQQFFNIMEKNGMNVNELRRRMEFDPNTSIREQTESKAVKKENKKMEAMLIQRISKLNNDSKFKKLVGKAEKAINSYYE